MTPHPSKRLLAHHWLYVPAACFPIVGTVIKLLDGSIGAALAVGAAPYVMYTLLRLARIIGRLVAVIRYPRSRADGREAMERRITLSANAELSIVTLPPPVEAGDAGPQNRMTPHPRHRKEP